MNISRTRLRAAVVTPTVLAGLVVSSLAGIASVAAGAAPAAPGSAETLSATAAPGTVGTAAGFLFYVIPDPQPTCLLPLGLNATADPSIDRNACAFTEFQVSGQTGAVTADLFLDGESTAFSTGLEAVEDTTAAGTFQVSLEPDATWPEGRIRMVVRDTIGQIGEFFFGHNQLFATVDAPGETAPGTPINVTGTITEHSARSTFSDAGVAATFTLKTFGSNGTEIDSQALTAAGDGTFVATIPGAATAGITAGPETGYRTSVRVAVVDAAYDDTSSAPPPATGQWAAAEAGATSHTVVTPATNLLLENLFVSSVGWVKPGDTYPSRIVVSNPTDGPLTPSIALTAPPGSTFLSATGPGSHPVTGSGFTWEPGPIAAGDSVTLVLESQAATTFELPTIVWRDLSSEAVMSVPSQPSVTATAHGPKVVPPNETYATARYGDRPFPVVPVQYTDRPYQADNSGDELEDVINDPGNEGSTFNLYQEMSLGQLFPHGTVPSAGVASADFDYSPGFDFTNRAVPGNTCAGFTYEDFPGGATTNPLYSERITDGVYNLPGDTGYYGSDSNGSAVLGSVAGVGALQNIDSGCGDTGKLVYDAAAVADPEIDYSDYDTDKDGVVDFFMVVFAGCGGNGASQLSVAGCDYPGGPYDNVWPHSSSLENGYRDPVTGLPGFTTDDQLKNLEGQPLWYTDPTYTTTTTTPGPDELKVFVRVGPYNVNPETAIEFASVISHEYGHSLGLPDFYSTGNRETYGDWNLMATDKSHHIDAFGRQELGWVVPRVLDSSRTVTGMKDSKEDTGTITWQQPDGTPYTLTDGPDGTVHNSDMYVAKLPGRTLLDASAFTGGDGATPSHLWWSGSGNDFGCNPTAGRNYDLSIPQLATLTDPNATVSLSMKSRWDIEWDYDYGFVLTTTDGGENYTSHASENGYTTGTNTIPPAASNNACQDTYGNGLTGSSGSYPAGTEAADRVTSTYPEPVFLADSFDISDLAGEPQGALRFSYATDPGLARPGWFIDDLKVTVDPDGDGPEAAYDVFVTDFETSGGPADTQVFNGGCRESLSTATKCTLGWKYLQAGAASPQDHAYYMEMRDRSGFDLDANGQADRGAPEFQPGFYLSYTDEAHGYGNAGTDDPPAQSPLDSVPEPSSATPNLNDAAFLPGGARAAFSDSPSDPHVDNYADPSSDSGNWEFGYGCLDFTVSSMSGETNGPQQADGDLTGTVDFTMGTGCGDYDYGYTTPGGGANTAPVAAATATPSSVNTGQQVTLSAAGTTDAETPDELDYSWDLGNGGATKDADGKTVTATYSVSGVYTATVTVTDPLGLTDTASATVTVTALGGGGTTTPPKARIKLKSKKPDISRKVRLTARRSTGTGPLTYKWNFHNGGKRVDATTKRVKIDYKRPGRKKVTLTVIDVDGQQDKRTRKFRVRAIPPFDREATPTYDADDLARLLWPW